MSSRVETNGHHHHNNSSHHHGDGEHHNGHLNGSGGRFIENIGKQKKERKQLEKKKVLNKPKSK